MTTPRQPTNQWNWTSSDRTVPGPTPPVAQATPPAGYAVPARPAVPGQVPGYGNQWAGPASASCGQFAPAPASGMFPGPPPVQRTAVPPVPAGFTLAGYPAGAYQQPGHRPGMSPVGYATALPARPGTVTAGTIIAMILGALGGLYYILVMFGAAAFGSHLPAGLEAAGLVVICLTAVLALVSLYSIRLSVEAYRGSSRSRYIVVGVAGVNTFLTLLAVLIYPLLGLALALSIVVLVLLLLPESNAWYQQQKAMGTPWPQL